MTAQRWDVENLEPSLFVSILVFFFVVVVVFSPFFLIASLLGMVSSSIDLCSCFRVVFVLCFDLYVCIVSEISIRVSSSSF